MITKSLPILKSTLLCTCMLMLGACASNKPQWPASEASTMAKLLYSEPPKSYSVSVKRAGESINSLTSRDKKAGSVNKVLNAMALETDIEGALLASLKTTGAVRVFSMSSKRKDEESKHNIMLDEIRAKIKKGTFDKSEFLSLLTKKIKLNSTRQEADEARLTVAYGLSVDGARVGLSAKLAYSVQPNALRTVRCEDEFHVSEISGLEPTGASEKRGPSLVRNFHVVRDAFQSATKTMAELVLMHVNNESVIFDKEYHSANKRLLKTDFVTFNDAYVSKVNALINDDGQLIGYSIRPSFNAKCGDKTLTIATTEQSQLVSDVIRNEKRVALQEKSNSEYLQNFGYQQNLRNQAITFKRLGLKH